jgi:hypothetical protein
LTSNSASLLSSSDSRTARTSFARFSSDHVEPNAVKSISPSGRYVFSGTDPNGKTYVLHTQKRRLILNFYIAEKLFKITEPVLVKLKQYFFTIFVLNKI